jgi:integrase
MEIAWLTGLRRDDILSITRDQVTDDGLYVPTSKTGKPLLFEWTEELREVVDRSRSISPRVRRYVICNRQGNATRPMVSLQFGAGRERKH